MSDRQVVTAVATILCIPIETSIIKKNTKNPLGRGRITPTSIHFTLALLENQYKRSFVDWLHWPMLTARADGSFLSGSVSIPKVVFVHNSVICRISKRNGVVNAYS